MYYNLMGLETELNEIYDALCDALCDFIKKSGLYYTDDDEYKVSNVKEIDCDEEMLASIENAYTDIKYYLEK